MPSPNLRVHQFAAMEVRLSSPLPEHVQIRHKGRADSRAMDTILRKHDRSIAVDAPSSELAQTQRLDAHTRLKPHACRMRSERIRCIGLVTRIARGDCFDAPLRESPPHKA